MKREESRILAHYEEHYFNDFQKEIGEFGGKANKFMFEKHVLPTDAVLDFGCGGGFLLNNLRCSEKIGVELNPVAREYCNNQMGITCYETLEDVPNESMDVVISSHCLEHTINPLEIVSLLYEKLKNGGKIVIVVPLENYLYRWVPNDVNNHLYSFSPMNLGNILHAVGFKETKTEAVFHKWVPNYKVINRVFGFKMFHRLSWLYGNVNRRIVQVKGVGIKNTPLIDRTRFVWAGKELFNLEEIIRK
jgi:SAM-dependent methyltransferase